MRARISIVVLAAAATASIAVAAIRIADATGDHGEWVQLPVGRYATTPVLADATRARMTTPSGFKRSSGCHVDPGTVCFIRSKSLLLNARVMARLLAAIGAKTYPANRAENQEALLPPACRTAGLRFRLSFQSCQAEGLIGNERLMVFARSTIAVTDGSIRPTHRSARGFAFPTEIHVSVLGHLVP